MARDAPLHELRMGQTLRDSTDTIHFAAGVFARSETGRLCALTAVSALPHDAGPGVFAADTAQHIGRLLPAVNTGNKPLPFSHAIGVVQLDANVQPSLSEADLKVHSLPAADMDHLLGKNVKIHGTATPALGTITTKFGMIRLLVPGRRAPTLFYQTFEAQFHDGAAQAKGGSLVTTEAGNAVGLIIAKNGDSFVIAPLQPLLRTRKMSLQQQLPKRVAEIKALLAADGEELRQEPTIREMSQKVA
jgi:hypothetical protein